MDASVDYEMFKVAKYGIDSTILGVAKLIENILGVIKIQYQPLLISVHEVNGNTLTSKLTELGVKLIYF